MVLVTAWNPMSRRMPLGWNRRMQRSLLTRLRRFQVWVAQGAFRQWHEEHVAVVCDPRLVARIGRVFRQRALVVVRRGQAARVVVLG